MDSVRYATELKTLVDYQAQQGREVLSGCSSYQIQTIVRITPWTR